MNDGTVGMTTRAINPETKKIILPFRHGQYAGSERVRECGGLPLTFPRGPRNFQWPISEVDGKTLVWRGRNVQICFQIYGRPENLGGGAEGTAVAGKVSFAWVVGERGRRMLWRWLWQVAGGDLC